MKRKKILAVTAVTAATLTAGIAVNDNNVHADVKSEANETTNDTIAQAQQKVNQASSAVATAQQADDQAQTDVNTATTTAKKAQQQANDADQAVTDANKAVDQAKSDLTKAQDHQSTVSNAVKNRNQVQADLNKAQAAQTAIAKENANKRYLVPQASVNQATTDQQKAQSANDQAQADLKTAQQNLANAGSASQRTTQADVDAAQAAKDQAQEQKNTADQQVKADSAAVQTANSNVKAAQTAANKAAQEADAAQETVNAKQQALQTAQQNLQKAQNQSGSTETAHKNVADILWIPDNFGTLMKGAFDEGAHLSQDQIDMLHQLYTKNVNAFTDHMDEIMSDADYDTTYDLSGRSYNVEDKQGHGTNAGDELSVFAADVLNAFRSKLGMSLLTVNAMFNKFNNYYNNDDHTVALPSNINPSTISAKGQSSVTDFAGVAQAYPIIDEPNTYSMDQLKYNLFLNLMQSSFEDNSTVNTQGDHAATLLGISTNSHNAPSNPVQYFTITMDPSSSDRPATAIMNYGTFAPTDQTAKILAPYDWTSKLDPASSNTPAADLSQLQQAVDDAQQALQSASADRDVKNSTKAAAQEALNNAEQALTDAQNTLDHDKQAAQETQDKLAQAAQKLTDVQQAFEHDQAAAASQNTHVKQLQQAVKDAQGKAHAAANKLSQANDALTQAKKGLQTALNKLNDWKSRKQAADNKVDDLQKTLNNATQADVDAANQAVKDAQTKLDNAQKQLAEAQPAAKQAQAALEEAQSKLTTAQNRKSETGAALAQAKNALADAQHALAMIQAVHGNNEDSNSVTLPSELTTDQLTTQTTPTGGVTKGNDVVKVAPVVNTKTNVATTENKGTKTVPAGKTTNVTNIAMTREAYKAQQVSADRLPQTGNESTKTMAVMGLGLATFAAMFGFARKRRY